MLHERQPGLLVHKVPQVVSRDAAPHKQRIRDPLDLEPAAFDDLLRPGELSCQNPVHACLEKVVEPLEAMHPFFPIDWVRAQDGYPNLVRELLQAWAWEICKPGEPRQKVDACLMFRKALPGAYVGDVEIVHGGTRLRNA